MRLPVHLSPISEAELTRNQGCSGSGRDRVVREYWILGPQIVDSNRFKSIHSVTVDSADAGVDSATTVVSDDVYRVTIHLVQNLPLTSKQKLEALKQQGRGRGRLHIHHGPRLSGKFKLLIRLKAKRIDTMYFVT